jgi:hypothetical protein
MAESVAPNVTPRDDNMKPSKQLKFRRRWHGKINGIHACAWANVMLSTFGARVYVGRHGYLRHWVEV